MRRRVNETDHRPARPTGRGNALWTALAQRTASGRVAAPLTAVIAASALTAGAVALSASASSQTGRNARAAADASACAAGDPVTEARQMDNYRHAGTYPATTTGNRRGVPSRVSLTLPPIAFTGAGQSSTLPNGPCQTIYRFAYRNFTTARGAARSPFQYIEVDWNTEGQPRGPNNSFTSGHFDFHFYLRPRTFIDSQLRCVSTNGRTCDQQRTPFAQMRRFLRLPLTAVVPAQYFPDTGSSIPQMGFHLLDGRVKFTVNGVNHNPVLLYGTFNDRLAFLEASVTQFNLQDLVTSRGHNLSYTIRQPSAYQESPWPTQFSMQYDPRTRRITATLGGFKAHRRSIAR